MPASLTRILVEAHLAESGGRNRGAATGAELMVRVDQALLDAEAAILALRALESAGCARVRVDPALVCAETQLPSQPFEAGEAMGYVQAASRRLGLSFSRPGNGLAQHIHPARFGAPGRTVVACANGAAAAGGLGMLVLPAAGLEVAAVLAGENRAFAMPPVWAIHLSGTLPPWVGAHDLLCALASRLPAAGAGAVLEYNGPGVAALPVEARLAIASAAVRLGAFAALFPSDAETRRWLLAQGREPDWKALAAEPQSDAAATIEIHLDTLDPMMARDGRDLATPVNEAAGAPVGRLVLGPQAGLGDLWLLAHVLRGRTLAPGLELFVIPGSRQIFDSAAASGALADLIGAGARVMDSELQLAPAAPAGATLLCGATLGAAGRARMVGRVGVPAIAAAALAGCVADPRELPLAPPAPGGEERVVVNDTLLDRALAGERVEDNGPRVAPLPRLPAIATTLRGVVLVRLGDRVSAESILSGGPRVRRHRMDIAALAGHLYSGVDRGFAARARGHGGGFVLAGSDYGAGPGDPYAALALAELRVRAVVARSFAPAARQELVRHGILALRFAPDSDPAEFGAGDELEIPGLPDVLEPNRPVALRDLTHGGQVTLHHDMTAREIEMACAGGLLAVTRGAGASA